MREPLRRPSLGLIACLASSILQGCGKSEPPVSFAASRGYKSPAAVPPAPPSLLAASPPQPAMAMMGGMMGGGMAAPVDEPIPKPVSANRKIIYNGNVDLVAMDLTAFESRLTALVAAQGGYVADSDRSGATGEIRHGTWKVRIPADRFDSFLKASVALGELVSLKIGSEDVSEEFYDLEARMASKRVEEARLIKLLADATGKLQEVLAVEKELSRVRSEIERMQGRLRVMESLTTLATVTISAREIKDYIPPQAPTFGTRIRRAFSGSIDAVREFGEAVAIFLVGLIPWLPLILLATALVAWLVRRKGR